VNAGRQTNWEPVHVARDYEVLHGRVPRYRVRCEKCGWRAEVEDDLGRVVEVIQEHHEEAHR